MVQWKWHECLQVESSECPSLKFCFFFSFFKARLNDRDEIRRKLAAGNESENENEDYYTSDYIKKTIITTANRRRQGKSFVFNTSIEFESRQCHQS